MITLNKNARPRLFSGWVIWMLFATCLVCQSCVLAVRASQQPSWDCTIERPHSAGGDATWSQYLSEPTFITIGGWGGPTITAVVHFTGNRTTYDNTSIEFHSGPAGEQKYITYLTGVIDAEVGDDVNATFSITFKITQNSDFLYSFYLSIRIDEHSGKPGHYPANYGDYLVIEIKNYPRIEVGWFIYGPIVFLVGIYFVKSTRSYLRSAMAAEEFNTPIIPPKSESPTNRQKGIIQGGKSPRTPSERYVLIYLWIASLVLVLSLLISVTWMPFSFFLI